MIRNRIRELANLRKQLKRPSQKPQVNTIVRNALWQNDYYHFKQQLAFLTRKNEEIKYYLNQYQLNPSLFNLQQLDGQIKVSCRKIDQIDLWVNNFPFSRDSAPQLQLERNLVKHFKQTLFKQINKVFSVKQQIADISSRPSPREKTSFNAFNQPVTVPYNELNRTGNDRNQSFKQVSTRIQNLNEILRRMGDAVSYQGDIINRIDENLIETHSNVRKGKDQLKQRENRQLDNQQSQQQCSCKGKINKAITILYVINLILIAILVLKNL